jgi:hypothetical protein
MCNAYMMNQMISTIPSKPKNPPKTPPTIGPAWDEERSLLL